MNSPANMNYCQQSCGNCTLDAFRSSSAVGGRMINAVRDVVEAHRGRVEDLRDPDPNTRPNDFTPPVAERVAVNAAARSILNETCQRLYY